MKKRVRTSKPFLFAVAFLSILWTFDHIYGRIGGPYPTVGIWDLEVSESELIKIVGEFLRENPNLRYSEVNGYTRSPYTNEIGFWFYYPDTKEIIKAYATPNDKEAFTTVQIYIDLRLGYFKAWRKIQQFETRVIDPLQKKIDRRKAQHIKLHYGYKEAN